MPTTVRAMARADIPAVAGLWAQYAYRSVFRDTVPVDPVHLSGNLRGLLTNPNVICLVGEYEGVVNSFLHAKIDFWLLNNRPFLSEIAMYPGEKPTHAAGLALLRDLHRILDERGITQRVVTYYGGLDPEKMDALLEHFGYSLGGQVMKQGF